MRSLLSIADHCDHEKALCRCGETRKAGLKLLFLTEIPLLVVTPLCFAILLLFLLFWLVGIREEDQGATKLARASVRVRCPPSPPSSSVVPFHLFRHRENERADRPTDRPTERSAWSKTALRGARGEKSHLSPSPIMISFLGHIHSYSRPPKL